ncbi:unnamed protein product [Toxocara canis]|uniref:Guanylate cyclase domain-containing protein n=1 Tax=Toxocara canis TaxID=6265 RepID=A0A183U438_TOXCA|nr:unnamed protein product [Toxocara canis]
MLILLIDPSEFLARASAFLFVLSRTLRASVQVAVENGDPMIFGWNLEGGLENLFKSSSANESETYMHQRSAMRGTLVVLTVDTSLCLADDCFTSLNDVAAYLGAAYANHVLQELKIPVYSARAEIPPNDNGMRNKILLLTIATMGTLIISLLAIQLIRKRKMVHVTKTWFPPLNDSYTSSNANLSECGIEKGVFDLEKGTISKRILPNIVPLTVPELFPREDNSVPLSPIRFSELPNETNRWTTQLHIEASSTAAISLPVRSLSSWTQYTLFISFL